MKAILAILIPTMLFCGCKRPKTAFELINDAVTNACQNNITGFQKVTSIDWNGYDQYENSELRLFTNAAGKLNIDYGSARDSHVSATVEYINKLGGYERTNLPLVLFKTKLNNGSYEVSIQVDTDKIFLDAMKRTNR